MTTTDKMRDRVIALRDRAKHANTPAPEAETAMTLARKLCAKHGIDVAILDQAPQTARVRDIFTGQKVEKKYSCRFGCPPYTQHTIDELNECAAKARARSTTGSAYDAPGSTRASSSQGSQRSWFDDFMRDFNAGHAGSSSRATSDDEFYTDAHGRTRQHQARATGSHAFCDHPATKAARAKCRRERGY